MDPRKTDKDARGGPMKIVYAIILVGIVAIIAFSFLSGRGPGDDNSAPVQSVN